MSIETTININKRVIEILNEKAKETGKSKTSIIKSLMQKIMSDNQKMLKSFSSVKYQAKDKKENWHKLHITLNEYEYEYYFDMRKFFKMSVSFILAFAVSVYLNEVVENLLTKERNADNYLFRNYIFIKETIDETICWRIYWGIPQKLPEIVLVQ